MVETVLILKGVATVGFFLTLVGGVGFWIWHFCKKYSVYYLLKYKVFRRPYDEEMKEVASQYENPNTLVYDTLREGGDHNTAKELKFIHNQLHKQSKNKLNFMRRKK